MDNSSLKRGIEREANVVIRTTYNKVDRHFEGYAFAYSPETPSFRHKRKLYFKGQSKRSTSCLSGRTGVQAVRTALEKLAIDLGVAEKLGIEFGAANDTANQADFDARTT